jgi:hypothetical protein
MALQKLKNREKLLSPQLSHKRIPVDGSYFCHFGSSSKEETVVIHGRFRGGTACGDDEKRLQAKESASKARSRRIQ